jgi:hypothetical protein
VSQRVYQQINLFQPIFRRQRHIFSAETMLQALTVVAVALATIYGYGFVQVAALEAQAVQIEGREKAQSVQLASLDPTSSLRTRTEIEQEIELLNATLIEQQRLVEVLREHPLGTTSGFSSYIGALARRKTEGLWLSRIEINGATGAIDLTGRSLRPDLVPAYLQTLGQEEALSGQRFDQFRVERTEDSDLVFRVSSRAAAASTIGTDGRSQ